MAIRPSPIPAAPQPKGVYEVVRRRFVRGLMLAGPFLVTIWILAWLYALLEHYLIQPVAALLALAVRELRGGDPLVWFNRYLAPLLALLLVAAAIFALGYFVRSPYVALANRILLAVPVVRAVHRVVLRVFDAFRGGGELSHFQRVVLVPFPHPGIRVPAFVTASCIDETTRETILCVYVPTTPIPTSGYMLMLPEESVTEIDWSLEETIQTVVSFGITAPEHVRYRDPGGHKVEEQPLTGSQQ